MKKSYILIALAMVAALTVAGCRNNNRKPENQEPTQEEIQAQKQALADSVLAKIDALNDEYMDACSGSFRISRFELTDAEKMVKPDYLLDPSEAGKLVTRRQKVSALAIYMTERHIREIYGMPVEEVEDVIAKLALEVNYPGDLVRENYDKVPISELIKLVYEEYKKNNDLASFWQFEQSVCLETGYLIARNPDLFFSRISDEQWLEYRRLVKAKNQAFRELSQYDEEIEAFSESLARISQDLSPEEWAAANATKESARKFRIEHKYSFILARNTLLQ